MKGSIPKENLQSNGCLQSELESLLLQQQHNRDLMLQRERELDIHRSGSAPPTVEGALGAAGSLFRHPNFDGASSSSGGINNAAALSLLTEEEIRSHPAYLEYYYSHENINPRLPPPLLSKEDWRVAQRLRAAGFDLGRSFSDSRGGGLSMFSTPPGLSMKKLEDDVMELRKAAFRNLSRKNSTESLEKAALMNLSQKNSAESLDKAAAAAAYINLSQRNSLESSLDKAAFMNFSRKGSADSTADKASAALMNLSWKKPQDFPDNGLNMAGSTSGMGVRRKSFADILQEGLSQPPKSNLSRASSQNSVAEALDSMRISNSHADEMWAKAESLEATMSGAQSCIPTNPCSLRSSLVSASPSGDGVNRSCNINSAAASMNASNLHPPSIFEIADVAAAAASLSGLNMPNGQLHPENIAALLQMGIPISHQQNLLQHYGDISRVKALPDNMNAAANLMRANGSTTGLNVPKSALYEAVNFPRRTSSTANLQHSAPPANFSTLEDLKLLCQNNNLTGDQTRLHYPAVDPHQLQYMPRNLPQIPGNSSKGILYAGELQALEKAYLEALFLQQAQQYHHQPHFLPKNGSISNLYPPFPPCAASYQENIALAQSSGIGSRGASLIQNEKAAEMASALRNAKGDAGGFLHPQTGSNAAKGKFESLLDVLKNNKAKALELSDITGHVVEFSMDQFGSRFIQQKLETATVEEKTRVLLEIIPLARELMVDVFGNYVTQKFFEHGTKGQQRELARHMIGHVLPLTLQMYGCRVVQKALEVVDMELQAEMIKELNGSVMKCVHDQNGNHVIQKCIECVPQEHNQFIISSFFGQVVTLSTHPYGCRVIQRVLEHCTDPKTQEIIMEEIMCSVCKLAQDQYGNYVIQHVVQHGKPHERSTIINKLSGQIVKMSQQKFASNVVEKCLTYCSPEERQLLVNEMLGSTDENEPLQAMMKDPFGNYVVQKVLETCDDKSRELILSRIKAHLNSLKRYTYGKHIVSRVEKLITTGEKHTGQSSST
ncbi:pumilio homolog 1-like [Andrographis paniculata]|uniref:pumilio homolog 1-like n=1 Tax=Andrographis paniculata TaxID=175694 RepID=UPI0021E93A8E|nr:pumilio homolog 1-like [Andrographis paniculata]XP_051116067.1 pumilio homolog 1-like [Andrographis paniculata]XP_051116068.1 pumilio homolog 1-like [Andrographis paniculata]